MPGIEKKVRTTPVRIAAEAFWVALSLLVGMNAGFALGGGQCFASRSCGEIDDGVAATLAIYALISVARYARWSKAHNRDFVRFWPEAAVFTGVLILAYGWPMDVTPEERALVIIGASAATLGVLALRTRRGDRGSRLIAPLVEPAPPNASPDLDADHAAQMSVASPYVGTISTWRCLRCQQINHQVLTCACGQPFGLVDPIGEAQPSTAAGGTQPKPFDPSAQPLAARWPRFFARTFDWWWETNFAAFTLAVVLALNSSDFIDWISKPGMAQLFGMMCLPIGLVLDALLYRLAGNTPGKALLGLRVTNLDRSRLSLGRYLERNFSLWASGLGFGLPLVSLFTMIRQSSRLNAGQQASYDEAPQTRVLSSPTGWARKTAFGLALLCLVALNAIAQAAQREAAQPMATQGDATLNQAGRDALAAQTTTPEQPIQVLVASQDAEGVTQSDLSLDFLRNLETYTVERVKIRTAELLAAQGQPNTRAEILSEATYVESGPIKLAVIRLRFSDGGGHVLVAGIVGNELKRVTCLRKSEGDIPIAYGTCADKIKDVFQVAFLR